MSRIHPNPPLKFSHSRFLRLQSLISLSLRLDPLEDSYRRLQESMEFHESTPQSEEEMDLRRGPWTVDEDLILINYIAAHGEGQWNSLARSAGIDHSESAFYCCILSSTVLMSSRFHCVSSNRTQTNGKELSTPVAQLSST